MVAVFCIVSWRVMWLTMMAPAAPDAPPTNALTPPEITILDHLVSNSGNRGAKQNTLRFYLIKLARLGGYLARASDPPPRKHRCLVRLTPPSRHSPRCRNDRQDETWVIASLGGGFLENWVNLRRKSTSTVPIAPKVAFRSSTYRYRRWNLTPHCKVARRVRLEHGSNGDSTALRPPRRRPAPKLFRAIRGPSRDRGRPSRRPRDSGRA